MTILKTSQVASTSAPQTTWIRLTVTVEVLEDAHMGTGSGGGGIDALIARDRRGWPVIWASHFEGVLRDAARRLNGENVANQIFGEAAGHQQRTIFTSLYSNSNIVSRIWRSSAREAYDNRAPKKETLRVIEHVPKGTKFCGEVELDKADLGILTRLFQEVASLGKGRAKGAGRVKISWQEKSIKPRSIGNSSARLILELQNRDPLCITATAIPGDLIPSLSYVPGRAMLGCLANWLIKEGHRDTARLLVEGQLSVTDALPIPDHLALASTVDVLPAPLALQTEKPKGSTGPIPWWAQPRLPQRRLDTYSDEANKMRINNDKLKRPEGDLFVCRNSQTEPWNVYRPTLRVRLRNGRTKPEQEDPELFALEQIVENTRFACEIHGPLEKMNELAQKLAPILSGLRWLRIGRSGVPVEVTRVHSEPTTDILAIPGVQFDKAILTLTSDLLVRDEMLRWCQSIPCAVKNMPGWPKNIEIDTQSILEESVAVYGFNGTSKLWRMPAVAIRRGSVFRVMGSGVAELHRLSAHHHRFGEHTHEGFGRFRVDELLPGVTSAAATQTPAIQIPPKKELSEEDIAITTHQWLNARPSLTQPSSTTKSVPSLSQWVDLVQELERREVTAISSRLSPTTAGAQAWCHSDAKAILELLQRITDLANRATHARFFLRWLRANKHGGQQ